MSTDPAGSDQHQVSNFNIANVLTVVRIVLVPFFAWALLQDGGDSTTWRWVGRLNLQGVSTWPLRFVWPARGGRRVHPCRYGGAARQKSGFAARQRPGMADRVATRFGVNSRETVYPRLNH